MSEYELMLILKPDLDEEQKNETLKSVSSLLESNKVTIKSTDSWGKRKFEYDIKGLSSGIYEIIFFQTNPASIRSLSEKLKLSEDIIRFMVTKKEK